MVRVVVEGGWVRVTGGGEAVADLVALPKELDGGALAHLHAGSTSESVGWQVRRELLPCRQVITP